MKQEQRDEPPSDREFDISVFEIPPAAAYFESVQQLQKINAKLDVILGNQCEILAKLTDTKLSGHIEEVRRKIARLYESYLARHFEDTGIDREALLNTIHPDDRVPEKDRKEFNHKSITF